LAPEIFPPLTGLDLLQADTLGSPEICVAVLDGPVDLSHPSFQGANLARIATLVNEPAGAGPMSTHGTHVTSVIFGQPDGPVAGLAPRCRGIVLPIFRDQQRTTLSQLDLARAIEQAVQEGAHIINISGGQLAPLGQADSILEHAIGLCAKHRVLVVAAAGNDGCDCLHVPAALPSVLAVGAMGEDGEPLEASNWGAEYRTKGVIAPGQNIPGAIPGGGIARLTGSSFATPIVSGVAALLLSLARKSGETIDPLAIGNIILSSTQPCLPRDDLECRKYLAGTLDVTAAHLLTKRKRQTPTDDPGDTKVSFEGSNGATASPEIGAAQGSRQAGQLDASGDAPSSIPPSITLESAPVANSRQLFGTDIQPSLVIPSADYQCDTALRSYIFAVGNISFDFGTEARRDSFRQLMPSVTVTRQDGTTASVLPNPYDVVHLLAYLQANPWESTKLIWTFTLDLTPIYAIVAEPAYAEHVYSGFRSALRGESLPDTDENYVSRVSISGVLTNKTVRLFSGQVVPLVIVQPRGLYTWNENQHINSVIQAVTSTAVPPASAEAEPAVRDVAAAQARQYSDAARTVLRNFLDKVYHQLRNLGQSPSDRALNYATTNAFAAALAIARAMDPASHGIVRRLPDQVGIYSLDTISVSKSPFCRMDSDCWDVQLTFFDPENDRRARTVILLTVDVSDELPVTLGPTRFFTIAS
jgi:cyanobactin maturation PatA/PatG family protease